MFLINTVLDLLYIILVWKPSFALKQSCLVRVELFHSELLNQAKNVPVVLQNSPVNIWAKWVTGFLSYDQTYEQLKRDNCFIYIDKLT